jgi:hypothetical protein
MCRTSFSSVDARAWFFSKTLISSIKRGCLYNSEAYPISCWINSNLKAWYSGSCNTLWINTPTTWKSHGISRKGNTWRGILIFEEGWRYTECDYAAGIVSKDIICLWCGCVSGFVDAICSISRFANINRVRRSVSFDSPCVTNGSDWHCRCTTIWTWKVISWNTSNGWKLHRINRELKKRIYQAYNAG